MNSKFPSVIDKIRNLELLNSTLNKDAKIRYLN